MKDFYGDEVFIGDYIALIDIAEEERESMKYKIIAQTSMGIIVISADGSSTFLKNLKNWVSM